MAIEKLELRGIEDYSVRADNKYEYYLVIIGVINTMFPRENRLSEAQSEFLARCCEYHANGGNLRNMGKLTRHFVSNGYLNDAQQVRNRKVAVGAKKWIKTGHNVFELPPGLANAPDNYIVSIKLDESGEMENQ